MTLSRVSSDGQVTIPAEIRRFLGVKTGDKISFDCNADGEIVISNASAQAIIRAQKAFEGAAEDIGIYSDDDVQALVNEVRYGICRSFMQI